MKKDNFKGLIEEGLDQIMLFFDIIGFIPKEHFTYEAIKELQDITNEVYPQGHKSLPTTKVPYGLYLGKMILDHIEGAQWVTDVDSIWDIYITFIQKNGDEMRVFPFIRVNKFWDNREDSLAAVFKMCQFVTTYDVSDKKVMDEFTDKDGWVHFAGGECFRILKNGEDGAKY